MYKTDYILIKKCRDLRIEGLTVREINKAINLSVGTVYNYIWDIPISPKLKEKIILKQIKDTRRIVEFNRKRKGKCIPGRIVLKPKGWTKELISLVAHFLFDGEIQGHSCVYHNRNIFLINHVRQLMKKVFNLQSKYWLNRETGVHRISYHYVELADYMRNKSIKLKKYIKSASSPEKKIFLRAFFDDEGCASWRQKKREVRGYQHNPEILKLIKKLLKDFYIESKIDEKYKEIIISRRPNLIKFRNKVNFSEGVCINPQRTNSLWKKKLQKRKILERIINSYQK